MPYSLDPQQLRVAFANGEIQDGGRLVKFHSVEVGPVELSSGAITACDPLVVPDAPAYSQAIPNGSFPVTLAIAAFPNQDERVAFARVTFAQEEPSHWRMALLPSQEDGQLGDDEFFGYGVDSGTGCFMDAVAGQFLCERMKQDKRFYDVISDDMQKTYRHTRSWLNFQPRPDRPENVICFSSGFGDGSYPSFFGLSADNRPLVLITDFQVLLGEESDVDDGAKPWWKFWAR
ncbi:MAG: DUF4241 domain-containing protein [Steroidobacteraceae bacterium]